MNHLLTIPYLLFSHSGKSSLLNALLDEASVLPTSGSQGCTATVVELSFNSDLVLTDGKPVAQPKKVPVYRGEVEFMTKEDWEGELRILVQECSTGKGRLYATKPHEKSLPAAAAAWSKINQGKYQRIKTHKRLSI